MTIYSLQVYELPLDLIEAKVQPLFLSLTLHTSIGTREALWKVKIKADPKDCSKGMHVLEH